MNEVAFQIFLVTQTCCHSSCGILFAVPKTWNDERRRDHSSFYCPNGHIQSYLGESDVEKAYRLRAETERTMQAKVNEARHAQLVAESERDKAIKAKRRIERRISKGVCACCNRTFADLQRHMATKHKDYGLQPGNSPKQLTGAVHNEHRPTLF